MHLLTDDPEYVDWLEKEFAEELRSRVQRVSLGLNYQMGTDRQRRASYSAMRKAKPVRMTGLVEFFYDLWLMVRSHKFFPTTGSTVTGAVAGYRMALCLAPNEQPPIGRWPGYDAASQNSRKHVLQLCHIVAASDFNPWEQQVSNAQREVLKTLSDPACARLDAFLQEKVLQGRTNPSNYMAELYRSNDEISKNRSRFQSHFQASAAMPAAKHWLGAVLTHRVNDYLMRAGADFLWSLKDGHLSREAVAYPPTAVAMWGGQDDTSELATGDRAHPVQVGGSSSSGGAAPSSPPPKRARIEDVKRLQGMQLRSKAAAASPAPMASRATHAAGTSVRGSTAKALPKPRPGK